MMCIDCFPATILIQYPVWGGQALTCSEQSPSRGSLIGVWIDVA